MLGPATEPGHVREHRDRGGAAVRVSAGDFGGPVVVGEDAHAGRSLLHLRDHGQPGPPQGADEVLRRVRGHGELELVRAQEVAPPLEILPGFQDETL